MPDRAVGKRHPLQAVEHIGRRAAEEEAVEGDDVGCAFDGQRQGHRTAGLGIGGGRQAHVRGQHAGLELQGVELAQVGVSVGLHRDGTVAPAEQVEVAARATADMGGQRRQCHARRTVRRRVLRDQQVHGRHGIGRQQQLGLQGFDLPGVGRWRGPAGGHSLGGAAHCRHSARAHGSERHSITSPIGSGMLRSTSRCRRWPRKCRPRWAAFFRRDCVGAGPSCFTLL